jgi:hypothetical protein
LPDATLGRWNALLDELERELADAGARDGAPWHPPAGLGPIPAGLVQRAQELVSAQQRAIAALEEERDSTRRHLTALRALPQQRNQTGPLYLDVSG